MLSTRVTFIALLAATCCLSSEADELLYDVVCPGVNSELQCPAGQFIKVTEITSGLISDADCSKREQAAEVTDDHLLHPDMIQWVKFICDNLEHCQLPKPNKSMFVVETAEDKFVQIAFTCQPKPADSQTIVTCENQIAKLKCESGQIEILFAKFGRFDKNTCTETPVNLTFAASYSAGQYVKEKCNRAEECTVTASSDPLGQPTPKHDAPMYLIVDYLCV